VSSERMWSLNKRPRGTSGIHVWPLGVVEPDLIEASG
jgi:hypothetical protein